MFGQSHESAPDLGDILSSQGLLHVQCWHVMVHMECQQSIPCWSWPDLSTTGQPDWLSMEVLTSCTNLGVWLLVVSPWSLHWSAGWWAMVCHIAGTHGTIWTSLRRSRSHNPWCSSGSFHTRRYLGHPVAPACQRPTRTSGTGFSMPKPSTSVGIPSEPTSLAKPPLAPQGLTF